MVFSSSLIRSSDMAEKAMASLNIGPRSAFVGYVVIISPLKPCPTISGTRPI